MDTNELEKQFFDTFGIEQKKYTQCCSMGCKKPNEECGNCEYHEVYKVEYPQISDRILLELICICSQYGFCPSARNIEDLKLKVLKRLLELKKSLKNNYEHQGCHNAFARKVRTLFKGEFRMTLYKETRMPRIDNPYECANYNEKVQNLNQTCRKGHNHGRCILYEGVLFCPEFKKKQEVINER